MRVGDILDAVEAALNYVKGMDFETFRRDRRTVDAVIKNFVVIGEAVGDVPDEIISAHVEIPWRIMRRMRNVMVHRYFGIDETVLWETIRDDLPPLVPLLRKVLVDEAG